MLDWPNLIAGAVIGLILGVLVTGSFWVVDRRRNATGARDDARSSWTTAAHQIEQLARLKSTTSADLYRAASQYPIDRWRKLLGPGDFRLLEAMQRSYFAREVHEGTMAVGPSTPELRRQRRALEQSWKAASVAFINRVTDLRWEQFSEVADAERRAELRADYRRHPIATLRREMDYRSIRRGFKRKGLDRPQIDRAASEDRPESLDR